MEEKKMQPIIEQTVTERRELTVEQMLVEVDKVKERWLKKEIKPAYLISELEQVLESFQQEKNYHLLKEYIEVKLLLDKNEEDSNRDLASIGFLLISFATLLEVYSISFSERSGIAILFSILSVFLIIGSIVVHLPFGKKYIGHYKREKSFYEVLLKLLQSKD